MIIKFFLYCCAVGIGLGVLGEIVRRYHYKNHKNNTNIAYPEDYPLESNFTKSDFRE